MKKNTVVFVSLALMLSACRMGVVPETKNEASSEASIGVVRQGVDSCPAAFRYVDPSPMHGWANSQVNGTLKFSDGSTLVYGQYSDAERGEVAGFGHKLTPDLQYDPNWVYWELTVDAYTVQHASGLYFTHTAGAIRNDQPVLAGSLQNRGEAFIRGYVERFASSKGLLDATYGVNGIADVTFGTATNNATYVKDMYLDSSNRAVVLAEFWSDKNNPSTKQIALARLTPSGQLDASFGSGGKVMVANTLGRSAVKLQPSEMGSVVLSDDGNNVLLYKMSASGLPDPTGPGRVVTVDLGGVDRARDLKFFNNAYYVGSVTTVGTTTRIGVAKLSSSFAPVTTFGSGTGRVLRSTDVAGVPDTVVFTGLINNTLMISGSTTSSSSNYFNIAINTSTGGGDSNFGRAGLLKPSTGDATNTKMLTSFVHSTVNTSTVPVTYPTRVVNLGYGTAPSVTGLPPVTHGTMACTSTTLK